METYPPKEVTCVCGNTVVVDRQRDWCTRCARAVYYHAAEQRKHKLSNIYILTVVFLGFLVLGYIFAEMIAEPLMHLK